jgi:hypothetical protein
VKYWQAERIVAAARTSEGLRDMVLRCRDRWRECSHDGLLAP